MTNVVRYEIIPCKIKVQEMYFLERFFLYKGYDPFL